MRIGVIIPVKKFNKSKQRLSSVFTLEQRIELTKNMLFDICDVLIESSYFDEIVIVSSEDEIAKYEKYNNITHLNDDRISGVNNAVEIGNKYFIKKGFESTLVIPGDIPLINDKVLKKFVECIKDNQVIITPSKSKNGTNLLFRSPPDIIGTSYDENSYFNHLDMIKNKKLRCMKYLEDSISLDLDEPKDIQIINESLEYCRTEIMLKNRNQDIISNNEYSALSSV
tara:strand:- start:964 stop:1641 length:678 start_codon:yes stop_codon:yes gene_type:complete